MKNSKSKGNAFERQIAKELSIWMFQDKDALKRHASSGTDKSVYCGDIVPVKQLNIKQWPFMIECKIGYKKDFPTFYKYATILKWYKKARYESKSTAQKIVILIVRFKHKPILFIANQNLNISENHIIIVDKELDLPLYIYDFKKVLSHSFRSVFDVCLGGMANMLFQELNRHKLLPSPLK